MKSWTEFHIAVVYYSGLFVALIIGIASLLYLKPLRNIKKLAPGAVKLWGYPFVTTVMMAGLLGAMSVSFTGCNCSYDCLLNSRSATLSRGLAQISTASATYATMFGMWFIVLLVIRMYEVRKASFSLISKITFIALLLAGAIRILYVLNNN